MNPKFYFLVGKFHVSCEGILNFAKSKFDIPS